MTIKYLGYAALITGMAALPTYNILSLDGGGIRGAFGCEILSQIELYTYEKSKNLTDTYLVEKYRDEGRVPVTKLFDMVAGTSTGSIMAGGLTAPKNKSETNPKLQKPSSMAEDVLTIYRD